MKKLLPVLVIAGFLLTGCKDPYGSVVKAGNAIAQGIGTSMQTIDDTRVNGLITPAEESSALDYLKFVNDVDGTMLTCASNVHSSGGAGSSYTACVQAFNASINTPSELALIKVSNPNGQKELSAIVDSLTTGASSLLAGLGGK